jgi:hypothetical protein
MNKEDYIQAIEQTMINNLKKDSENNPMVGTAMESYIYLESLNRSSQWSKDFLKERNLNLTSNMNPFKDEEIEEMVKIAYSRIYNELFEK